MNDFAFDSNEYELRKLGERLVELILLPSLTLEQKSEMADLFVEYGHIMELTPDELEEEIRSVFSMTWGEVMDAINSRNN